MSAMDCLGQVIIGGEAEVDEQEDDEEVGEGEMPALFWFAFVAVIKFKL